MEKFFTLDSIVTFRPKRKREPAPKSEKSTVSEWENPLCDATVFDGFRRPLKCEFYIIKIHIIEIGIQRCINQIFLVIKCGLYHTSST